MDARDRRLLPLGLNALGIAAVAYAFFTGPFVARHGEWLGVAAAVGLVAWALVVWFPYGPGPTDTGPGRPALRWIRRVAAFAGIAAAALAQAAGNGIHVVTLAVIVVTLIADLFESPWLGAAGAALAFVLTPVGCLLAGASTLAMLSYLAGVAVFAVIGLARRQARTAIVRDRELEERRRELAEQEARTALLADRQAAARDIHDLLAHSLGGLVVQLDAVEALLEAGHTADARAKAAAARALAAEGLAEARRAVAALRSADGADGTDPADAGIGGQTTSAELADAAGRLLDAHRALGGSVAARVDLGPDREPLPQRVYTAIERALREALSNARKHAPGEPVDVELRRDGPALALTVANRLPGDPAPGHPLASTGGGHGLAGMAERFAELPGGQVHAGAQDGRFVVAARARTRAD